MTGLPYGSMPIPYYGGGPDINDVPRLPVTSSPVGVPNVIWIILAIFLGLFALGITVLFVVGRWTVFSKAGEKGWKALIPFYSDYVLYRLIWDTKFFWIDLALCIAGGMFASWGGRYVFTGSGRLVISVATPAILLIAVQVGQKTLSVFRAAKYSLAFGKGVGVAFGLILIPPLFELILGLGHSTYRGVQK